MISVRICIGLALSALALMPAIARTDDDFLLLADSRPLLIRFKILIDGEASAVGRTRFLESVFTDLDRDRDGALNKKEAARTPSIAFLQGFLGGAPAPEAKLNLAPFERLDRDGDGRCSKAEFNAYYATAGLDRARGLALPLDPTDRGLTALLFSMLDVDGDGKLSKAEGNHAREAVLAADFNGDEWIDKAELILLSKSRDNQPPAPGPRLLQRTASKDSTAWETAIRRRYADAEPFRSLLDGAAQPDLELAMRLESGRGAATKGKQSSRVEVLSPPAGAPLAKAARSTANGNLQFNVDTVELSIAGADRPEMSYRRLQQYILQEFQVADTAALGRLTLKEVDGSPIMAGLHALADADADGRITREELVAFLEIYAGGAMCLISVVVEERGPSLFDLFDANQDGRLSLHELAHAGERLLIWDRNADVAVALKELPTRVSVRYGIGKPSAKALAAVAPEPKSNVAKAPDWFRKLDRNGDGYVSLREWLGDVAAFSRLDSNADELLSPQEAANWERPAAPAKP